MENAQHREKLLSKFFIDINRCLFRENETIFNESYRQLDHCFPMPNDEIDRTLVDSINTPKAKKELEK